MGKVILIVFALMLPCNGFAQEDDSSAEQLFADGNEQYERHEFDSAIVSYATALTLGEESAPLYFNLGNAYFKNGDIGHSILYYLRARKLDPSNSDIASNLNFAQSFTSVQMEGVQLNPVEDFLESLVGEYHLNSLAWLSSLFFVLLFGLLSVRFGVGIKGSVLKTGIITALSLTLVFGMLTSFKYRSDYLTHRAVLIGDDCPVLSGPNPQSKLELQGSPGLVVEILSESEGYFNVLFENKRRGWLKKELLAVI